MASSERKAVSQFPYPPRQYIDNCATDRAMPPPPPPVANYHMFGREYRLDDIEDALVSPHPPPLPYPHLQPQHQQHQQHQKEDTTTTPTITTTTNELRRLNIQLLNSFIQLIRTLCTPPTSTNTAEHAPHELLISKIEETFSQMQQLINSMRPTQAVMDLKSLLEKQTKLRRNITDKLKQAHTKAWELCSDAADNLSRPSVQLSDQCVTVPLDVLTRKKKNRKIKNMNGNDVGSGGGGGGDAMDVDSNAEMKGKTKKNKMPGFDNDDDDDDDDEHHSEFSFFDDAKMYDNGLNWLNKQPKQPSSSLVAQLAHIVNDPSI